MLFFENRLYLATIVHGSATISDFLRGLKEMQREGLACLDGKYIAEGIEIHCDTYVFRFFSNTSEIHRIHR